MSNDIKQAAERLRRENMTHDEMIAVIQAAKDGKQIQCRDKIHKQWCDSLSPVWDFHTYDCRVKPEPRRVWVRFNAIGGVLAAKTSGDKDGFIEFVEVVK